jgi:hypothetical protein
VIRICSMTPFGRKAIRSRGWPVLEFKVHDAHALRNAYRTLRKGGESPDMTRYIITTLMSAGKYSRLSHDGGESWT